jgi:hypothetical protein
LLSAIDIEWHHIFEHDANSFLSALTKLFKHQIHHLRAELKQLPVR